MHQVITSTSWNKLCNVDFLKRNDLRFKEGIIHEDILWSFYLANFANSMYALEDKTYIYNTRETSIMGAMKITMSKDCKILIYSDINSFLAKRGLDNKDDIAYIYRIKFEMFNDIRGWSFKDAKPYMLAIKKATKVSPIVAVGCLPDWGAIYEVVRHRWTWREYYEYLGTLPKEEKKGFWGRIFGK